MGDAELDEAVALLVRFCAERDVDVPREEMRQLLRDLLWEDRRIFTCWKMGLIARDEALTGLLDRFWTALLGVIPQPKPGELDPLYDALNRLFFMDPAEQGPW